MTRMFAEDHIWMPNRPQRSQDLSEGSVDLALENLASFDLVGFTDDVPGFVNEITNMSGVPPLRKITAANVTEELR